MPTFFPASLTLLVIVVLAVPLFFAMRVVQPAWWRSTRARRLALGLLGALVAGVLVWVGGRAAGLESIVWVGAGVAYVGVLTFFPASLTMPVVAAADRLVARRGAPPNALSRRALFALPALTAATSASGFASAEAAPIVRHIPLRFAGLHPDLEGLRILQLSDVHLGAGRGLVELRRALADAMITARPDLIVLTGDLADDPSLIPAALRMVTEANARYGAYACLGNHEYHHITESRPAYEQSDVPLLVGSGRSVRVGRATLYVGGADDPVHMRGDLASRLRPTVRAAAKGAPAHADFRLLLSHRPEGHGPAAEEGFDLTLAGHTHGGQLGFLGKSFFELLDATVGWWGAYAKPGKRGRTSRLYTTSGFGHWFGFRLGCPAEIPILVLEREEAGAQPARSDQA
ncbi:MAG: metallophosphoesterase [Labilithrix sp.]|nr:metallophosphoesterase [Labilithrix sp.]MCW5810708.1 metallophosphoesterase [Labilithrix sp.]